MQTQIFYSKNSIQLESGHVFTQWHLAYSTCGKLNATKDNVVWIFHALTANSNAAEWWSGLVGVNKLFSPKEYYIICVNMPGSCYGSINPLDINPGTQENYYHQFPWFNTRDMIIAYQKLKNHLGINKIYVGIGGSMGGQQLLEWAIEEPELFNYIIPIATNAQHSPWGIAFNTSQRMAIEADITWRLKQKNAGENGLKVARSIALLSYRNYQIYHATQQGFNLTTQSEDKEFLASTYQKYQGEKLVKRFNAFSYYFLTKGMDYHNVGRNRTSIKDALKKIAAKTLVIGISSDILFPISEQALLAELITDSKLIIIDSIYGHDGFLLEYEQLNYHIKNFLTQQNLFIVSKK